MTILRHLKRAAWRGTLCLCVTALVSSCFSCHHNPFCRIMLVSYPASAATLQAGDLAGAVRILEPRLDASPQDAELSYTLGSVYLVQSDAARDRATRRSLRDRGWRLVEAASGRSQNADALLAHAYLVGRWGKPRSSSLHGAYVQRHLDDKTPTPAEHRAEIKRTWAPLSPP